VNVELQLRTTPEREEFLPQQEIEEEIAERHAEDLAEREPAAVGDKEHVA
jgi:hypothetical protein